MSRLSDLRAMRDFIDREIATELGPQLAVGRDNATVARVAEMYGVTVEEILGGNQCRQVARARHGVAWLLRRHGMSFRDIAKVVGYGDHTSAHHACSKVDRDAGARALLIGVDTL